MEHLQTEYINIIGKGNKKRAELMLNEYLEKENEKAVSIPIENITTDNIQEQNIMFCDFIGEWLELQKSNIQTITYNNYYSIWQKHVYSYFKRLKSPLDKLQPIQVHKYYSDKMKSGLNPNTVLKHHALIRSTLQYAKKGQAKKKKS